MSDADDWLIEQPVPAILDVLTGRRR